MPVNSPHPDYLKKISRWKKNRDAYEGEDSVKAEGKLYLLQPGGFEDEDYKRYIQRAKWYNGLARTIRGIRGLVFQKDPTIQVSDIVKQHMADVTLTGISTDVMARELLGEVNLQGRYGVLVDYSEESMRPYWNGFPTENILNWAITKIKGEYRLSLLVIEESFEDRPDMFEVVISKSIRVCLLDDSGQYQVQIYGYNTETEEYTLKETLTPTRRGSALEFIPFQIFGSENLGVAIDQSPLDNLSDTCYAYYRHSADYEHALYLTGIPTPVITGHQLDPGERLPIGSLSAWVIPNEAAKAYLLEYTGHGLQEHERAMDNDKKEMATHGARLLEERPNMVETLGAVQLRHSGELGMLKSMANLESEGLTRLIRWHHWWNGDTEDMNDPAYTYMLNTDFDVSRLNPQELQALIAVYQAGRMSDEVLFWNMKQGEMIPNERTFEEEQAAIESRTPARLPFGDMPPDDEEDEPEVETEGEGDAA